jgi:Xaa-Pro dipeptidase
MRKEIIERQIAAMKAAGLDALIACSPENFAYATGFVVPSQPLMRHRHAMVIVCADGRTGILGVDMEATTIRTREPSTPTHIWAEFTDDAMAVLARMLAEMGLGRSKIAI